MSLLQNNKIVICLDDRKESSHLVHAGDGIKVFAAEAKPIAQVADILKRYIVVITPSGNETPALQYRWKYIYIHILLSNRNRDIVILNYLLYIF